MAASHLLSTTCTLDLTLLTNTQLLSLRDAVFRETIARKLNSGTPELKKRKERVDDTFLHKWEGWVNDFQPRNIVWKTNHKRGQWEIQMIIKDEQGSDIIYHRIGKNKAKTKFQLAKMAWYKFLNKDDSSDDSSEGYLESKTSDNSEEENLPEVLYNEEFNWYAFDRKSNV